MFWKNVTKLQNKLESAKATLFSPQCLCQAAVFWTLEILVLLDGSITTLTTLRYLVIGSFFR